MIHSVKEFRQVNIDRKYSLLFDDISYLQYRLFGISILSKTKTVSRKERVKQRGKNLSNGLLDHSLNNGRDPQFAFTAIGFINLYTPNC